MKKKEREEWGKRLEKIKEKITSQIEHLENNSLNKSQRELSGDISEELLGEEILQAIRICSSRRRKREANPI